MQRTLGTIACCGMLLAGSAVSAAERTIELQVDNMTCVSCPYIVEQSLAAVPGVSAVTVSVAEKKAVVTFDDAQTEIVALIAATANVGFPSQPLGEAK